MSEYAKAMLVKKIQHHTVQAGSIEMHVHGVAHVWLNIGLESFCNWERRLEGSQDGGTVGSCISNAVSATVYGIFV